MDRITESQRRIQEQIYLDALLAEQFSKDLPRLREGAHILRDPKLSTCRRIWRLEQKWAQTSTGVGLLVAIHIVFPPTLVATIAGGVEEGFSALKDRFSKKNTF